MIRESCLSLRRSTKILAMFALANVMATGLSAQSIYATLTGVVSDPAQAVVPGATVRLKNQQSGSQRDTVTNAEGYFTFASLSVGDFEYQLTVEAKGFSTYKATGIALTGGEKRNINVTLEVGTTTEAIQVTDTYSGPQNLDQAIS